MASENACFAEASFSSPPPTAMRTQLCVLDQEERGEGGEAEEHEQRGEHRDAVDDADQQRVPDPGTFLSTSPAASDALWIPRPSAQCTLASALDIAEEICGAS